jgi:hypothetical protein
MPDRKKIVKRFVYDGFGFPVVFRNVPMIEVRGAWTPKVDYNKRARAVVLALALKPARLTGSEIRFVRQYFEMTLERFGERFDVTHAAVWKWESAGLRVPKLSWTVEKDIRLSILDQLDVRPREFKSAYERLRQQAKVSQKPIEMDLALAA